MNGRARCELHVWAVNAFPTPSKWASDILYISAVMRAAACAPPAGVRILHMGEDIVTDTGSGYNPDGCFLQSVSLTELQLGY
jgi:ABC-type enterochelin transport system permease subunit